MARKALASFTVYGHDLADLRNAAVRRLDALLGEVPAPYTYDLREISPYGERMDGLVVLWQATVEAEIEVP